MSQSPSGTYLFVRDFAIPTGQSNHLGSVKVICGPWSMEGSSQVQQQFFLIAKTNQALTHGVTREGLLLVAL